jgi:hypothetical protein
MDGGLEVASCDSIDRSSFSAPAVSLRASQESGCRLDIVSRIGHASRPPSKIVQPLDPMA